MQLNTFTSSMIQLKCCLYFSPHQFNLPEDLEFWDNPLGHILWRTVSRSLLHNPLADSESGPQWELWRNRVPAKHTGLLTVVKPSNCGTQVQTLTDFSFLLHTRYYGKCLEQPHWHKCFTLVYGILAITMSHSGIVRMYIYGERGNEFSNLNDFENISG